MCLLSTLNPTLLLANSWKDNLLYLSFVDLCVLAYKMNVTETAASIIYIPELMFNCDLWLKWTPTFTCS